MPQIKTSGKNPGITLTQGERTRWQATIDDLTVVVANSTAEQRDEFSDARSALTHALELLTPAKDKDDAGNVIKKSA